MNRATSACACAVIILLSFSLAFAQQAAEPNQNKPAQPSVPVTEISADLGSCSVNFTVTDMLGKPIYDAKIKTQLRYGFLNKRKLDLEAGTNSDGRARFIKMPNTVKEPIVFEGTYRGDTATMTWDPGTNCEADYPMILGKKPENESTTQ